MFKKIGIFVCALALALMVSSMSSNCIIIKSAKDLNGKIWEIPYGCTLIFHGNGCLANGTLVGNNAVIRASGDQVIFKNMTMSGSFETKEAFSEWFGIKDDCVLDSEFKFITGTDNTQNFRNLFLFKNITIKKGKYLINGQLSCKSNQTINGNDATIKSLNNGPCIVINSDQEEPIENVSIRNLNIIGSKLEFDKETQWWHGISVGFAHNVTIDNVTCKLCRGDGFYVGNLQYSGGDNRSPENITFKRVKALNNYRQGLSITRGDSIIVEDSEFSETSGTLPHSGVDIEPNVNEEKGWFNKCNNISFSRCVFKNNESYGLIISAKHATSVITEDMISNVAINQCSFINDALTAYGVNGLNIIETSLINGGILMVAYGRIQNVSIDNVTVDFDKENNESGFQLSLMQQPCKNVSISNFRASNCGTWGLYVTRGKLNDSNGKPSNQLNGLILQNIQVSNCSNSVFISEYVNNAVYDGLDIKQNGIDRNGRKMKSRYGNNLEFMQLDDKATRIVIE